MLLAAPMAHVKQPRIAVFVLDACSVRLPPPLIFLPPTLDFWQNGFFLTFNSHLSRQFHQASSPRALWAGLSPDAPNLCVAASLSSPKGTKSLCLCTCLPSRTFDFKDFVLIYPLEHLAK